MTNLAELIEDVRQEVDYDYEVLTPVTKEFLGNDIFYRKEVKTVAEAERFNYHSDYWGDADYYQEQNVTAMEMIEPYIGEVVEYDGQKLKIIAMLIDKQYNSIGHTDLLIEEVS